MKKQLFMAAAVIFGSLFGASAQYAQESAELGSYSEPVQAKVFQAAGVNAASIQSAVDQYRVALGGVNNGNAPGPIQTGRREINWDGGGSSATSPAPNPFDGFLNIRGTRFTTTGTGFVQATPAGIADTFDNPSYASIFQVFSPTRLFSPVGSNVTDVLFFLPGSTGTIPATTRGFGAVFTDVDQPDGSGPGRKRGNRHSSTLIRYYDAYGRILFSGSVPASPGDGSVSFFGIVLDDPRIARVRIITGNRKPGRDDERRTDIVMMDDFLLGEPQPLY